MLQKWHLTYPKTFAQLEAEGIIRPGVLIESMTGSIYLIGDLSPTGGACDHCAVVKPEDQINGYCVVWGSDD